MICCVRSASFGALGGRKRERFVLAVGVQRLRSAEYCGQGLQGHAHDVVFGLLRGERRAAGLRVKAQHQATRIAEPKRRA